MADGVTCETTLRAQGPMTSPHLMAAIEKLAQSHAETAPALSDAQEQTLRRILHQDASARDARQHPVGY